MRMLWIVFALTLSACSVARADETPVVPLRNAHAHNDYEHARPLHEALEHGFCSVEADIFLTDGRLLVGHTRQDLRPERTLESLYLDPLRQRIRVNGGRVYRDGPTVYLLIDVKTEANATYIALDKVLSQYADILSEVRQGKVESRAVTAVVSGNRAKDLMARQEVRFAGFDGRSSDLASALPAHLMPWISDNWSLLYRWRGEGPFPEAERTKLQKFVAAAHGHGRLVRFWATPESPSLWKELRAAGVDLINTDKLAELKQFLLREDPALRKRDR